MAWPRSCCCFAPTQAERPFRSHASVGWVTVGGRSSTHPTPRGSVPPRESVETAHQGSSAGIQAICAQAGLPAELAGLACWFELLRGCRAPAGELVALAGGGAPMAEVEERGEHEPEPVAPA